MNTHITQAELMERVSYDPETGAFTWLTNGHGYLVGKRADHLNRLGYRRIAINQKWHQAHRVAWLYMTGEWPDQDIDHKNMNRADNRFENLRLATRSENQMNIRGRGSSSKGTTFHRTKRFQAQIKRDGRNYYLGLYASEAEAAAAYKGAAKILFGEFARTA